MGLQRLGGLWALLGAMAGPTQAADLVRLATGEFPPFVGQQLPLGGFYSELQRAVWREAGLEAEVQFMPWARGQAETKGLERFGTFPYLVTPERERDFLFSAPFYTVHTMVFVRADSPLQVRDAQDLRGLRVCRETAAAHPEPLRGMVERREVKLVEVQSLVSCFRMMQLDRVDFVAINGPGGWSIIQQAAGDTRGFKTVGPPLATVEHRLMVGREHPQAQAWLARFDAALERLRKRGELQALAERHLPKEAR